MAKPASKLSLQEITNIARDVVSGDDFEVVGTLPTEGDSEYAELVVVLNAVDGSSVRRMSIGVHRAESAQCVREEITRRVRTAA